jgi:hypothetical protein
VLGSRIQASTMYTAVESALMECYGQHLPESKQESLCYRSSPADLRIASQL